MKLKTLLFTLFLSLSTFAVHAKISVDSAAPDFSLVNEKGEMVTLSDYKGKYVILEWTNHLCPYVQKHYGSDNMQGMQGEYTDQDAVWLSIISSAPGKQGYVSAQESMALTDERSATPSHVLFDPEGDVGRMYSAKTTPHMYIIDPAGILRYAGAIDSIKSANPADIDKADNYVDLGMSALMAGKQVANKLTPPYGCSIKYKS
jgi:peroxiredoxin